MRECEKWRIKARVSKGALEITEVLQHGVINILEPTTISCPGCSGHVPTTGERAEEETYLHLLSPESGLRDKGTLVGAVIRESVRVIGIVTASHSFEQSQMRTIQSAAVCSYPLLEVTLFLTEQSFMFKRVIPATAAVVVIEVGQG